MRRYVFACTIIFFAFYLKGQQVTKVTDLPGELDETSGLVLVNGKLITITDSGGEPCLYEISSVTGDIDRRVYVRNATNVDWEAICSDQSRIYVGDIGNNHGNRTNLRIYAIEIQDYLTQDTVTPIIIDYSYKDQIDFSSSQYTTNYDAEAMISIGSQLYIYTKNWGNQKTYIYSVPNTVGTYQSERIDSIDSQCLITGATIDSGNSVVLTGYTYNARKLIHFDVLPSGKHVSSSIAAYSVVVPSGSADQIEAVCYQNSTKMYLSSEDDNGYPASLYLYEPAIASVLKNEVSNVIVKKGNVLYVNTNDTVHATIYSLAGEKVLVTSSKEIYLDQMPKGVYLVRVKGSRGDWVQKILW